MKNTPFAQSSMARARARLARDGLARQRRRAIRHVSPPRDRHLHRRLRCRWRRHRDFLRSARRLSLGGSGDFIWHRRRYVDRLRFWRFRRRRLSNGSVGHGRLRLTGNGRRRFVRLRLAGLARRLRRHRHARRRARIGLRRFVVGSRGRRNGKRRRQRSFARPFAGHGIGGRLPLGLGRDDGVRHAGCLLALIGGLRRSAPHRRRRPRLPMCSSTRSRRASRRTERVRQAARDDQTASRSRTI